MKSKILITGPPKCGKSTLISELLKYFFNKNYTIHGFLTPELRKEGKRVGFDIEDIHSRKRGKLARIVNYNSDYKLGKYCVFLEELEEMISNLEIIDIKNIDLLVIDEIGKMELYSRKFHDYLKRIFISEVTILATIGLKLKHPIKNFLLNLSNIKVFNLNQQNFQNTYHEVISKL